jgi:integrase
MKGHIRERSPGHWAIVVDVRDPQTGKRKRRWHSFAGTKRAAQIECARIVSESAGGLFVDPGKITVAAFLDRWLDHMRSQLTPKSHERYCDVARKNVTPLLGAIPLLKLTPVHISDCYAKALSSGRRIGSGGLSAATVAYMHRILKQALSQAVVWRLLPRNPAAAVKAPRAERSRLTTYDIPQTAHLIDGLRGSRLLIPVLLAAMCGLRRGEIVALRWRHIDLVAGKISVVESAEQTAEGVRYKQPKSGRGRSVALSSTIVEELRAHWLKQAEEFLRLGIRPTEDAFVYTREDGEPLQPRSLSRAWTLAVARLELPRIRFHDLRHAHATHLLASGVHPKVASERLGHSQIGITLDSSLKDV